MLPLLLRPIQLSPTFTRSRRTHQVAQATGRGERLALVYELRALDPTDLLAAMHHLSLESPPQSPLSSPDPISSHELCPGPDSPQLNVSFNSLLERLDEARCRYDSSLLTTHFSLLTTHYSLLTTHYPIPITHYSLLTAVHYYSLLTTTPAN